MPAGVNPMPAHSADQSCNQPAYQQFAMVLASLQMLIKHGQLSQSLVMCQCNFWWMSSQPLRQANQGR